MYPEKIYCEEDGHNITTNIYKKYGGSLDSVSVWHTGLQYNVEFNGRTTVVILSDGSIGTAKCNPEDEYDQSIGMEIALLRAKISQTKKKVVPSKKAKLLAQIKETEDKIAEMKKEISTL